MSTPIDQVTGSRLRTKLAAMSVAAAAVGVTSAILLTASAQADNRARPAATTIFAPINPNITFGTVAPSPTVTLPPGITFITIPFPSLNTTPTTAAVETTATETTEATTETTEATESTSPSDESTAPQTGPSTPTEGLTLDITAAQINCDGMIHVEYATTADPQPATAANHLIVFNPTSNPTDFHVVETVGNPANGAFAFEQLGSIEDTYRVFVVALFDPVNPDGPKLVDQADVLLAPDC